MKWLHRKLGHHQTTSTVSVPAWDPSARGLLIRCSCDRVWAL